MRAQARATEMIPAPRSGFDSEDARPLVRLTAAASGLGALALVSFAAFAAMERQSAATFLSAFGVGAIAALATLGIGALLGFLFAIPRSVQIGDDASDGVAGGRTRDGRAYRPNTNLEQISDWLTKILVGVGLVQLTTVGPRLADISERLGLALGGSPSSSAFSLALLVYFAICGFVLGYLATRLFMPGVLQRAEGLEREARAATLVVAAESETLLRRRTLESAAALVRGAQARNKSLANVGEKLAAVATGATTMEQAAEDLGMSEPEQLSVRSDRPAAERLASSIPQLIRQTASRSAQMREASVLWVDDRPENNSLLSRALQEVGAQVTTSVSTDDALSRIDRERYDLIISDVKRPEARLAGYELLEAVRRRGLRTPFIFYTSDANPNYAADARKRGAQGLTNNPRELFRLVMDNIGRE